MFSMRICEVLKSLVRRSLHELAQSRPSPFVGFESSLASKMSSVLTGSLFSRSRCLCPTL
jgi:hypothetical protein